MQGPGGLPPFLKKREKNDSPYWFKARVWRRHECFSCGKSLQFLSSHEMERSQRFGLWRCCCLRLSTGLMWFLLVRSGHTCPSACSLSVYFSLLGGSAQAHEESKTVSISCPSTLPPPELFSPKIIAASAAAPNLGSLRRWSVPQSQGRACLAIIGRFPPAASTFLLYTRSRCEP